MAYLIFNSPKEAELRSEQAGKQQGLSYHSTGSGTRYWWGWSEESAEEDPRAYIVIQKNISVDPETEEETVSIPDQSLLTEEEIENLADELPEDWVTASANPDGGDDEEAPTDEDGND